MYIYIYINYIYIYIYININCLFALFNETNLLHAVMSLFQSEKGQIKKRQNTMGIRLNRK